MVSLLYDAKAALRRLAKTPWFTLAVVATLAVAIGANTLIFSIVDGVLLRPLPLGNAGRLVAVSPTGTGPQGVSVPDLVDWRQQCPHIDGFASYVLSPGNLTDNGTPVRLNAAIVSANWFSLLGVVPERGRAFAPNEDTPQATKVVILSDGLWRSRFGGSPSILGRSLQIDGDAYTVVGVAPRHFTYPSTPDVWIPLVQPPAQYAPAARGNHSLRVIGRIAQGSSMSTAREELATVTARLRRQYPQADASVRYAIVPWQDSIIGDVRPALFVLFGAIGCVLLIACANVASLLLVRATGRATEMALRVAIGADRRRIIQQLLVESVVLALIGALAGIAVAAFGIHLLVAANPGDMPRLEDVTIGGRVLAFTILVAGATGVLFGFAPAFHASRIDLTEILKSSARGSSAHRNSGRVRNMLVVTETSIAVVLLVGAGLLMRSLLRMAQVDPGFRAEQALVFNVNVTSTKYLDWANVRGFVHGVNVRLAAMPGTRVSGYGMAVPFGGFTPASAPFHVDGRAPDAPGQESMAAIDPVSPGFFTALGIPVRQGRVFTDDDRSGGRGVVVINHAAALQFFPDGNAIGQRITLNVWFANTGHRDSTRVGREVVGIVGDTKLDNLTTPAPATIYLPYDQASLGFVTFVVRTTTDPAVALAAAARAVTAVDPEVPIFAARTLKAAVGDSAARPRLYAAVVAAFAAVALLLALIGIYGVLAYTVRERRRELGIRIALGARQHEVVAHVVGQGLRLTGLGLTIGLTVAWLGGRVLASLLFGIQPTDLLTYEIVCITLLSAALLASWLPAHGAATIDPAIAMRPD